MFLHRGIGDHLFAVDVINLGYLNFVNGTEARELCP
jgi:hypothetical protein